jgi:hypothetical protein
MPCLYHWHCTVCTLHFTLCTGVFFGIIRVTQRIQFTTSLPSASRQNKLICGVCVCIYIYIYIYIYCDSVARGPKLLSIKNYVIEIMTLKFIYTYREQWKTGPAHNRCWNWSPLTSKHTWMRFSKFWNTFPEVFGASSERITLYMSK